MVPKKLYGPELLHYQIYVKVFQSILRNYHSWQRWDQFMSSLEPKQIDFIQIFSSGGAISNSGRADTCFLRDRHIVCARNNHKLREGVAPTLDKTLISFLITCSKAAIISFDNSISLNIPSSLHVNTFPHSTYINKT